MAFEQLMAEAATKKNKDDKKKKKDDKSAGAKSPIPETPTAST
jgi:hypothetical protein